MTFLYPLYNFCSFRSFALPCTRNSNLSNRIRQPYFDKGTQRIAFRNACNVFLFLVLMGFFSLSELFCDLRYLRNFLSRSLYACSIEKGIYKTLFRTLRISVRVFY